eukprot:3574526-Pyramimonas_sp.AAC.1
MKPDQLARIKLRLRQNVASLSKIPRDVYCMRHVFDHGYTDADAEVKLPGAASLKRRRSCVGMWGSRNTDLQRATCAWLLD